MEKADQTACYTEVLITRIYYSVPYLLELQNEAWAVSPLASVEDAMTELETCKP